MAGKVFGLLDVGRYKVYRVDGAFFLSHRDAAGLRRVRVSKKRAEAAAALSKSDVPALIEQSLLAAKVAGTADYYEMRHRR